MCHGAFVWAARQQTVVAQCTDDAECIAVRDDGMKIRLITILDAYKMKILTSWNCHGDM